MLQQLATIVKPGQIQEWEMIEPFLQGQIARAIASPHRPTCIVYPQTQEELAEIVACTHHNGWTLLPCGAGSKLHWGGLAQPIDVVISTTCLNRVIDHAVGDLTITAEAGLSYADLQTQLDPRSQHLALDPCSPDRATLGGMIATADAGFLRQRYGGARDMVIGISFVRSDGQLTKAGGRVVKNVAGYDLMKLLTGSWGSLGIITQLTLRLYPQPDASKTILLTGDSQNIETVVAQLFSSSLTPTVFTILLPKTTQALGMVQSNAANTQSLALLVRFQSIGVSVNQQTHDIMAWGTHHHLSGHVLEAADESMLWHHVQQQRNSDAQSTVPHSVTCKVGVRPAQGVATLAHLIRDYPNLQGWIHASSGLGLLWTDDQNWAVEDIEKVRSHCEACGGFLTVLEAPEEWKQSVDLWGYKGNALPMMRRIKQQFDPDGHLSPGRFVTSE
ncbi:MAG: FAD-binding oxidoreductase [Merismopedia sp. SIO2A8]|nr:FAD-binding oxidoreductase [Symploca sp. SIO2B6]NET47945.1 FAD-binding oxidoreductase [Merismopedia sp. SIO2A8]